MFWLLVFLVWALIYNFGAAHIREALQANPKLFLDVAKQSMLQDFFMLNQLDSWILLAGGIVLSIAGVWVRVEMDRPFPRL